VSTTENSNISQFLTTSEESRKLIFMLRRELVRAEWSTVEQVGDSILTTLEEQPHPQVLMDLSELEHMGSSMVAMLVNVWKSTKAKEGAMVFVCEENGIYEVLKLAGLTNVWTIKDNRPDALKLLVSPGERTGGKLGLFLVVLSLLTAALSGAMYAMILTGRHDIVPAEQEPIIQAAAGIVSGLLGFWAFLIARRVTRVLGVIFGLIGIGLAVQALVT